MPYLTQGKFDSDFEAASKMAAQTHSRMYAPVSKDIGWKVYCNARNPGLECHVFGRHVGSEQSWSRGNIGIDLFSRQPGAAVPHPTANRPMSAMESNFGVASGSTAGSILMMGPGNWNFTINDCWLLGGIHSHVPFYPASPFSAVNIFNANLSGSFTLTITGREFLGLLLGGYALQKGHEAVGVAMVCSKMHKADTLDLPLYQHTVSQIESTKNRQIVTDMAAGAGVIIS